jgi:hypothetical protein
VSTSPPSWSPPRPFLDRGRSLWGGSNFPLIRGRKSRLLTALVWSDAGTTGPAQQGSGRSLLPCARRDCAGAYEGTSAVGCRPGSGRRLGRRGGRRRSRACRRWRIASVAVSAAKAHQGLSPGANADRAGKPPSLRNAGCEYDCIALWEIDSTRRSSSEARARPAAEPATTRVGLRRVRRAEAV